MSSPLEKGGRALVLRLLLAEVLAKPGEGPLAPRFVLRPRPARPATESAGEPTSEERA